MTGPHAMLRIFMLAMTIRIASTAGHMRETRFLENFAFRGQRI